LPPLFLLYIYFVSSSFLVTSPLYSFLSSLLAYILLFIFNLILITVSPTLSQKETHKGCRKVDYCCAWQKWVTRQPITCGHFVYPALWRDSRVSELRDVFRVETKRRLNMQFWHRVICVTDLESYYLLPIHVLYPIAHCPSTTTLLLTFVHRNKPSFFFVHTEHLLWFSHWEGWFPYTTISDWSLCNGDALFVSLSMNWILNPYD